MSVKLPTMNLIKTKTSGVSSFRGYDHNLRVAAGAFYDMRNMTGTLLPVMASRPPRRRLRRLERPNGLFAHDWLCWVDGTDFVFDGAVVGQVTDGPKKFVRMGAYVLIWPDKAYYNTSTGEFGNLGAVCISTSTVSAALCKLNGEPYGDYAVGEEAPAEPVNGALWMDTSVEPNVLRQYVETSSMWTAIPTVYTKLSAKGIGAGICANDGVSISGFTENEALNSDFYVVDAAEDSVTIVALIPKAFTQESAVTVERKIPDMDFVCECRNRIYGCSSEKHEIYVSALGDAKNWNQFLGLSSDSYAATVGSAGDFTGVCPMQGDVLFFKENMIHRLIGTQPSNFQLQDTYCRGLARGSEKSLCLVNETLFYKSAQDVCALDTSLPYAISRALGPESYTGAVGGAVGGRYYLCMRDAKGGAHLFVYDTASALWVKEDETAVRDFAALDRELYYLTEDGWIYAALGGGEDILRLEDGQTGGETGESDADETSSESGKGTASEASGAQGLNAQDGRIDTDGKEKKVEWMLETGDLGMDEPSSKYISGIQLHAECGLGTTLRVEIEYNHTGAWEEMFRASPVQRRSMVIPLIPRRCRTLRLRLSGEGECKLFSIVMRTEEGSDVYAAQ